MALSYLFDPNKQFQDKNGVNNVYGYLYVFINDSDDHAPTYCNFTGTFNPEKIVLDNNGRAVVIVDEQKIYRIEVYDRSGNMLWSQYPVRPTNVNYGDNNVFNYYADIYGTPDEIDVDVDTSELGVKTFTVKLDDAIKEIISNNQSAISDIISELLNKKDRQSAYVANGSATKTVKKVSQNANGELEVEFENIEYPQQAPNVNIVSPNNTLSISSSIVGSEKTFSIDVNGLGGSTPYAIAESNSFSWNVGLFYTTASLRLTDIKSNNIQYNSSLDGWKLKKDHVYIIAFNAIITSSGSSNQDYQGRFWLTGYQEQEQVWQFVVDDTYRISKSFQGTAVVIGKSDGDEISLCARFDEVISSNVPNIYLYKAEIVDVTSVISGGGGSGTDYSEGDGIKIENDSIGVDYGDGLEIDENNKLKLKIGNGLAFDEDTLSIEINQEVDDVVKAVEKLQEDLDEKITSTYNFAQITTMGDFASFGITNTNRMMGELFEVPITTEIRKDETLICVNALQNYAGKVSIGLFEFDFTANGGTGSTYWIADTGTIQIKAGENEFPIKNLIQDANRPKIELMSSRLYYIVLCVAGDAPTSGLMLAAAPSYSATYNAHPIYTMVASNLSVDWTTGNLSGTWFQGHNEVNTIPRLFAMIRNGTATPVVITGPFEDIGIFSLYHNNRVSDIFSLTPDTTGKIYSKVIPNENVTITKFRYVDYHGSVSHVNGTAIILDENYDSLVDVDDGTWTLGDADQTKIDGTYFVHEFTLTTPIQLVAGTPYWFMTGGNLSNQGNDWVIQYQNPYVSRDLLLAKDGSVVGSTMIPNDGEFKSSQIGMYLKLFSDNNEEWVI